MNRPNTGGVDTPPQCDTCPLKELLEWSLRLIKAQGKLVDWLVQPRIELGVKTPKEKDQ